MADQPTRELAEEIARHLFTAYSGTKEPVHCDQIWLYRGDRRVAGWAEMCVADLIETHLNSGVRMRTKR